MSRTRANAARVSVVAGALLLTACGSSTATAPTSSVRDQSNDVPFTSCQQVKCVDTLNGAKYEIVMPTKWNGTLLIYSHGYREAKPAPPTFTPVDTAPEPAPGWESGQKQIGQALLDQGYAATHLDVPGAWQALASVVAAEIPD